MSLTSVLRLTHCITLAPGLIYSLEEDLKDAVGDLKAAVNVP